MSEETVVTEVTAPIEPTNTTPTVTDTGKTTEAAAVFTQAQVDAIIKERLDRADRKAAESTKKATEAAEQKALKEQGKYEELYKATQAELEAERNRAKALELAALKRDTAAKLGVPAGLAARLQGDTAEDIENDARALLESLPKPTAPNINAASGGGHAAQPLPAGMSEESIVAQAVRLGVDPVLYRKQLVRS